MREYVRKLNAYQLAEDGFLLFLGCYLLFLLQASSTFYLQLPAIVEKGIFLGLVFFSAVKALMLFWKNKESVKKWIVIPIFAVVSSMAFYITYKSDGVMFLKFYAVIFIGMLGVDYNKVIKIFVCILTVFVTTIVLAALSGVIPNFIYLKFGHIRSSWGVNYPTDYASYVIYLCLFLWIGWRKLPDWVSVITGIISFFNAMFIARSSTSAICSILFVLVIFIHILIKWTENKDIKILKKLIAVILSLAYPVLSASVFGLIYLYGKGSGIAAKVNGIMSGRIQLAYNATIENGITLLGTPFKQIGAGGTTFSNDGYNFVDISYPLILIRYGIVVFVVIMLFWILMTWKAAKLNDFRLALGMGVIAFHSFSEHHMIEANFNVLIILPFAVLGMGLLAGNIIEEPVEEKATDNALAKKQSAIITAIMLVVVILAFGPLLLSVVRTLWTVTEMIQIRAKMKLTFVGFSVISLCFAALIYYVYSIILNICTKKKCKIQAVVLGILLVVSVVGIISANMIINTFSSDYEEELKADEKAVQLINSVDKEYGGKLYASSIPLLYQKKYGGFSNSFFNGEELARLKDVTVIVDSNLDSSCFMNKGFVFTQISENHAVYSNNKNVVDQLGDAGFHSTGYYSKKKYTDGKKGTYLDIRDGVYTIFYSLSLVDKTAYDQNDFQVCTLYISRYWGNDVLVEQPVFRSQFDENGHFEIGIKLDIEEARGVAFWVIPEGEFINVDEVSYQKTPENDVRLTYDSQGRIIREDFYDLDGNPLKMPEGYYAAEYEYDDENNISRLRYYDENGKAMYIEKGYSQLGRFYDENRQIIRDEYFDIDGNRMALPDHQSALEYEYDEYGNISKVSCYGIDDEPVMVTSNYFMVCREYDANNRVIREDYYDINEQLVNNIDGYATLVNEYDSEGNKIKITYYDNKGNVVER